MKNRDYSLSLNIAEIVFGILLASTTFIDQVHKPVQPLEQKIACAEGFSQGYIYELRKKTEEFPTAILRAGGYALIINGAYSMGKRKR